jgi:hypothetical protein
MRSVGRGKFVLVLALIISAASARVWAADDPETLIHEGIELRKAGQDALAEGYIRRAYQLAATPRTAAQLGLVELAVGDYLNAELHLSEALTSRDAWILSYSNVLENSRAMARRNLLRVEVIGAPAGATFAVDDAQSRPLPTGGAFWIAPDSLAAVTISAPGRNPTAFHIRGAAGQVRQLVLETPAVPAAASVTLSSPRRGLRVAAIASIAVGVAAVVAGGIFYERGVSELHDYQAAIRSDGQIPWNPNDQNWESTRNWAVAGLVAGGVAVAGGVSLFLLGGSANRAETPGTGVSFVSGSGERLLSFRGSF